MCVNDTGAAKEKKNSNVLKLCSLSVSQADTEIKKLIILAFPVQWQSRTTALFFMYISFGYFIFSLFVIAKAVYNM